MLSLIKPTLLALSLCSLLAVSAHAGDGNSIGGNGVNNINENAELTEESKALALKLLRPIFNRLSWGDKELSPGIQAKLFNGPKTIFDILDSTDSKLLFVEIENDSRGCKETQSHQQNSCKLPKGYRGNYRDGSALESESYRQICISRSRVQEKTKKYTTITVLMNLLAHELSHFLGLNECEAVELQLRVEKLILNTESIVRSGSTQREKPEAYYLLGRNLMFQNIRLRDGHIDEERHTIANFLGDLFSLNVALNIKNTWASKPNYLWACLELSSSFERLRNFSKTENREALLAALSRKNGMQLLGLIPRLRQLHGICSTLPEELQKKELEGRWKFYNSNWAVAMTLNKMYFDLKFGDKNQIDSSELTWGFRDSIGSYLPREGEDPTEKINETEYDFEDPEFKQDRPIFTLNRLVALDDSYRNEYRDMYKTINQINTELGNEWFNCGFKKNGDENLLESCADNKDRGL